MRHTSADNLNMALFYGVNHPTCRPEGAGDDGGYRMYLPEGPGFAVVVRTSACRYLHGEVALYFLTWGTAYGNGRDLLTTLWYIHKISHIPTTYHPRFPATSTAGSWQTT